MRVRAAGAFLCAKLAAPQKQAKLEGLGIAHRRGLLVSGLQPICTSLTNLTRLKWLIYAVFEHFCLYVTSFPLIPLIPFTTFLYILFFYLIIKKGKRSIQMYKKGLKRPPDKALRAVRYSKRPVQRCAKIEHM